MVELTSSAITDKDSYKFKTKRLELLVVWIITNAKRKWNGQIVKRMGKTMFRQGNDPSFEELGLPFEPSPGPALPGSII